MRETKGKKRTALIASFYALVLLWSATAPASGQADADAQFMIGRMHEQGLGVPQDYAKAVEAYRHAAEQGHAQAQSHLGDMYYYGRGAPQNYAKAAKWYQHAAESGDSSAQLNLGFMYGSALDDPENLLEGTGADLRHIKIRRLAQLEDPAVRALIAAASGHLPKLK